MSDDTTSPEQTRARRLLEALVMPTILEDMNRTDSPRYWGAVARSLREEDQAGPAITDALADAIDRTIARFEAMRERQEGGGS